MGDDGGHRPILCIVEVVVSATITVTTITVTSAGQSRDIAEHSIAFSDGPRGFI
jgi:hypothetical protein